MPNPALQSSRIPSRRTERAKSAILTSTAMWKCTTRKTTQTLKASATRDRRRTISSTPRTGRSRSSMAQSRTQSSRTCRRSIRALPLLFDRRGTRFPEAFRLLKFERGARTCCGFRFKLSMGDKLTSLSKAELACTSGWRQLTDGPQAAREGDSGKEWRGAVQNHETGDRCASTSDRAERRSARRRSHGCRACMIAMTPMMK